MNQTTNSAIPSNNPEVVDNKEQSLTEITNLNVAPEKLMKVYKESEKQKRTSGIIIIVMVSLVFIILNIINFIYVKAFEMFKWSLIIFILFLIPTLLTKFSLIKFIIDKWLPFLVEPNDFIASVRQRK